MRKFLKIIWAVILIVGILSYFDLLRSGGSKARVLTHEEAAKLEKLLRESS